jgi:hypothetical protein
VNGAVNHEVEFVKAFVNKRQQDRFVAFVTGQHREKFTRELAHGGAKFIDSRFKIELPGRDQNPEAIALALKSKGAPESCHLTSEHSSLDNKNLNLLDALKEVVGRGIGTIISCIPGKLAYFEGEEMNDRFILFR